MSLCRTCHNARASCECETFSAMSPITPTAKATPSGGFDVEKYRARYAARPETFDAYVDVWKRLSGARQFPGGWTHFSRAANEEPAIEKAYVRRAEELMRHGGYEIGRSTPGGGRRWFRTTT